MKNKYLKGAHLSERKVRELMKLFCEDLTATQIANITGISRITVNAYFKLIRTHIARFCEEKNPCHYNNGTLSFIPLENGTTQVDGHHEQPRKKSLYGIFRKDDLIYTDKMHHIDPVWLYDWLKGRIEAPVETLEKHRLHIYKGIADFNTVKLHRVNGQNVVYTKGKSQIDEIDLFWGMLKSRLVKFRGLNGSTLYLHVKETEFRYNYRQTDIYDMLLDILHQQPLHYSKAMKV